MGGGRGEEPRGVTHGERACEEGWGGLGCEERWRGRGASVRGRGGLGRGDADVRNPERLPSPRDCGRGGVSFVSRRSQV